MGQDRYRHLRRAEVCRYIWSGVAGGIKREHKVDYWTAYKSMRTGCAMTYGKTTAEVDELEQRTWVKERENKVGSMGLRTLQ